MKQTFLIHGKRTALGSFNGQLGSLSAIELATAICDSIPDKNDVEELFLGLVLSGNVGQNPARQVCVRGGLVNAIGTQVNKVCASGMKAIAIGDMAIKTGSRCILVIGSESMSNGPYYVPRSLRYGHVEMRDSVQFDGLTDPFHSIVMGVCADTTASKYGFSREDQDAYAMESYKRAIKATTDGDFKNEIIPLTIKNTLVDKDENISKFKPDKMDKLKPVFTPNGTVTAATSSPLSDGAAGVLLCDQDIVDSYVKRGLLTKGDSFFEILGCADAEQDSKEFITSPHLAIPIALKKANISMDKVDYFEINEAFAVAGLVNAKLLNIPLSKVNIRGGAVAMGHPLGCSGVRIVVTLMHILESKNASIGVAAICNGGGGASAIVIERIKA